jgi:hypothetical protein
VIKRPGGDPAPSTPDTDAGSRDRADLGFLGRWSDLKREAREPAAPGPVEPAPQPAPEAAEPGQTEAPEKPLPDLESLDERSDYTGFMSPQVSRELRRLALRKLFHLPSFNLRDGLDDYDDDFTQFAKLGDIVTRDMRYRMEVEARQAAEKEQAAAEAEARAVADGEIEPDGQAETDTASNQDDDKDPQTDPVEDPGVSASAPRPGDGSA